MVRGCLAVCLLGWKSVGIRSSLHSVCFGQLLVLHCAHKSIVNIMKVYIEKNNRQQVELIRFRKKISPLFKFTKRECSQTTLCLQPIH